MVKVLIEVEVTHVEGLFQSKDDIAEAICDQIVSPYGSFDVGDSSYEVTDAQQYFPQP